MPSIHQSSASHRTLTSAGDLADGAAKRRSQGASTKRSGPQGRERLTRRDSDGASFHSATSEAQLQRGESLTRRDSSGESFHSATSRPAASVAGSAAARTQAASSAKEPAAPDRQTLRDNLNESEQKLAHARFKLFTQVVGGAFLVATLVTTAVLCPPALVLVAPVCVFAGHALLGQMHKTLAAKELAHIARDSARSQLGLLDPPRGGHDGAALDGAPSLARTASTDSQDLTGFDEDEEEPAPSLSARHLAPRDGLAAPTKGAATGQIGAGAAHLEKVDQSVQAWLEAREIQKKSLADLQTSTLDLRAVGADLRAHLEAVEAV